MQRTSVENDKNKPLIKKWIIGAICFIAVLVFVFLIPIAINELYLANTGYITLWSAADVLSYYAEILSGVISIGALIATIYYSKKDTQKQINLSQSQLNVPFFIIDKIDTSSNCKVFCSPEDGHSWKIEYSMHLRQQEKIFIILKNIGNGIAISPHLSTITTFLLPAHEKNNPNCIRNSDTLMITYILSDSILNCEGNSSCSNVTLEYRNIVGIKFNQQISIQHSLDIARNSATIIVEGISFQHVDL